jgi:murein endopeptidase
MQDIYSGRPPQYAAVVFDDPVLRRIIPSNNTLQVASTNWAAVAAAMTTAVGLQNGSAYSQAAGRGAALLFLLSKEFQVVQTMQRRFGELPPINLMHNASAQHALPSLLSGLTTTAAESNAKKQRAGSRARSQSLGLHWWCFFVGIANF